MPRTLDEIARERLGRNFREARERHKWTQIDAAAKIGVPRVRLNKWEKGRETPGAEGLLLLAIAYACSVDQLLSGLDERYDEIIERGFPVDQRQHYRAKIDVLIRRTTAAMQLALDERGLAPMPAAIADTPERARGKSGPARARRTRRK